MTTDVFGERRDRSVAPRRLLLHRLEDDGVEIAAQRAIAVRAWWENLPFADDAGDLCGVVVLEPMRTLAREQLIQHGTERIDVSGRGHRLAPHLLGAHV